MRSHREQQEAILTEIHNSSGGAYARQMIQSVTFQYREEGLKTENPMQDLKDLL